jgi:hypothetical protein
MALTGIKRGYVGNGEQTVFILPANVVGTPTVEINGAPAVNTTITTQKIVFGLAPMLGSIIDVTMDIKEEALLTRTNP